MLVFLAEKLTSVHRFFSVFEYTTLRVILASLTGFLIAFFLGKPVILKLREYKAGQPIRDDGPKSHFSKAGTPTMGGLLVLVAIVVSTLLWTHLENHYVWIFLFVLISFGAVGFVDDYRKLVLKNSKGLSSRTKYFWLSLAGILAVGALYLCASLPQEKTLLIPFFKNVGFLLSFPLYLIFGYCVVVGSSNAVNLTDGLDGLAIVPCVLVGGALGIFAYLSGHAEFSQYLWIPHLPETSELAVICGSMVGAGLGFLWFNSYPAEVFMGDVGSLSLGGALGILAVMVRQEFVLFIMGGIFVVETLSVMIQVLYFKYTGGKRVFKMAPIHHHFELCGWPEPKVVTRFWIITLILTLVGLLSLKLR